MWEKELASMKVHKHLTDAVLSLKKALYHAELDQVTDREDIKRIALVIELLTERE